MPEPFELNELQHEVNSNNEEKIEAEFGDLFFSIINAARLYDVDPETALERTNRKFIKRFNYLEEQTLKKGISLKDMSQVAFIAIHRFRSNTI